ncbi:hypothetical protein JNK13_00635 [bacterium]|nr:hypothetical protein [bacterium]
MRQKLYFTLLMLVATNATAQGRAPDPGFFDKDFVKEGFHGVDQESNGEPQAVNDQDLLKTEEQDTKSKVTNPGNSVRSDTAPSAGYYRDLMKQVEQERGVAIRGKLQKPPVTAPAVEEQSETATDNSLFGDDSAKKKVDSTDGIKQQGRPNLIDTLNLIVSATEINHARSHIESVIKLHQSQSVKIGEISLIGVNSNEIFSKPELISLAAQVSQVGATLKPLPGLLKDYAVTDSPVWVVEHAGKRHIFEGGYEPHRLFARDGSFDPSYGGIGTSDSNVVRYERIPSRIKFSTKQDEFALNKVLGITAAQSQKFAEKYQEKILPKQTATKLVLPKLPICASDDRRELVGTETGGPDVSSEITYYAADDFEQRENAKALGFSAVAFPGGKAVGIGSEYYDSRLTQALHVGLKCLPTRLKMAKKDGTLHYEFLEGRFAFEGSK